MGQNGKYANRVDKLEESNSSMFKIVERVADHTRLEKAEQPWDICQSLCKDVA